jgi:hypothetical protein
MQEQTVVEPPPGSEPWLLALIAPAIGDEDAESPEQARAEQNQALVDRGVVSPKVVARYEDLHASAVGVSDATPHVVRVRYVVRIRTAPTVVRRTQPSGRPAHSHSSRSPTARGSPDDPDLPEDLEARPLPKEVRAALHRLIREEHFRRDPALAAARFAPLSELARDQRLCTFHGGPVAEDDLLPGTSRCRCCEARRRKGYRDRASAAA